MVSRCSGGHLWHLATPSTRRKAKKVLKKQVALLADDYFARKLIPQRPHKKTNVIFSSGCVFRGQEKGAAEAKKTKTFQVAYMSGTLYVMMRY